MSLVFNFFETCFPRSAAYLRGIQDEAVRETSIPFRSFPYQERHLQCLWADPRHRPAGLKTSDGEAVEVEHPGDWNLEAGPDFLNAAILIGKEKRRVCGDLEIHIHANGWHQHGHANDPRYENVRFHIVYIQGMEIPGLIQVPLQEALSTDPCFSFENIDLTAYPYSIPSGDFPLKGMNPDQKTELLESAGEERLRLKAERLAQAMQHKEPEQVLWEELMASLGYKNNKAPFRRLATALPLSRLRSLATTPDEAYALLLGLSGLLPTNVGSEWNMQARKFIRGIWDCWWKQSDELKEIALKKSDWTLSGIRPANHPVRRLMAAAHYTFSISELVDNENLLIDFPDNFWNTHISWKTKCESTALVGQARANAITTNILIPFRAAIGNTQLDLDKLPAEPTNSIIRQTAHTLFSPDHTPKVYRSALARQGLIQIFHDYLITHRLDELAEQFGGTTSSLSAAGEDTSPPEKNTIKTGGTTSPLSASGKETTSPENSATETGGTTPPLSAAGEDTSPPENNPIENGGTTSPLSAADENIAQHCPSRKHPAHHPALEHSNRMPIIMLTICSHKRRPILADATIHKALLQAWGCATQWLVGRYVVMPDHIHLFCSPASKEAVSIAQWAAYWKRLVSQQVPGRHPVWQRDCWDTQLRSHESYSEKWSYFKNNPVRAGLADSAEAWPYQGTLNHLQW